MSNTQHPNNHSGKQRKISILLVLALVFFVIELVGGYATSSIALIADSFHMLSDVASLIIALVASKLAKSNRFSSDLSYGLQRAEVLGALINGVGLLALCFTLIISAIQRLVEPEVIENPHIVLYVASAGLVVNVVGLFLFHEHSHAGHSHHHIGEDDSEDELDTPYEIRTKVIGAAEQIFESKCHLEHLLEGEQMCNESCELLSDNHLVEIADPAIDNPLHNHHETSTHAHSHHHDLNLHGVFLHVLGDLLASIGVIVSSLLIIYVQQDWTVYMDPLMSLMITIIMAHSSLPLVKSACFILLQGAPSSVSVEYLRKDILKLRGVIDVHELHVWQLSDTQTVASVHVVVPPPANSNNIQMEEWYMNLASKIKQKMHEHGIHSTTVQPEFVKNDEDNSTNSISPDLCMLRCESRDCESKTCCRATTSE